MTAPSHPSPPSRGAWIEIPEAAGRLFSVCGRPPRGGRGLKFPSPFRCSFLIVVAPLAGGVD